MTNKISLGKRILQLHLTLISLCVILYLLKGFDKDEFTGLLSVLTPITSVFLGVVFKFINEKIQNEHQVSDEGQKVESKGKFQPLNWLIWAHFSILCIIISVKAFAPFIINFNEMMLLITILESSFGGYVATIITSIYK